MTRLQFSILYREFLFRMVDRELLSAHAQGDSNKLLGRFAAILIWVSIPFGLMAFGAGGGKGAGLHIEHTLISTTMLVVGLFAVLSWDSTFPDRRDVLVLAPLPVVARTMFAAKAASMAAALGMTVAVFNAAPGVTLPLALTPPGSNLLDLLLSLSFLRPFAAYWFTVLAAGAFIFCAVLCVQGVAAQLPRAIFLRVSAFLQVAAFGLFVGVYFLQPPPPARAAWSPSHWFLDLFQQLNGLPNGQAGRAWLALALATSGAGTAFLLSYFRTLRRIVEEPDIAPGFRRSAWLPPFGNSRSTAIVQFSIRTLVRSRPHRVIFAFYAGLGFAVLVLFIKTPIARQLSESSASDLWHQVSVPLLASSFVIMCFWMLGIRVVFAMPLDLRANWVFRIVSLHGGAECLAASRRAIYVLGLAPMWTASALVFLANWPWRQAAGHLAVLGLVGVTLAELFMHGFQKIPFTCSYLPGKSNIHITFSICVLLGLNATLWAANFERRALWDARRFTGMIGVLTVVAVCAWLRTQRLANPAEASARFDEEQEPAIVSLGI